MKKDRDMKNVLVNTQFKFTLAEIKILDYKGFDLVTDNRAVYDTMWVSKIGNNEYLKSNGEVDIVINNLNDLLQ